MIKGEWEHLTTAADDDEGRSVYLVDPGVHERLVETLADRSLALRAAAPVTEA